jgi:UDP-N-acetylglucosamine 1-carboxyvinyltransferase
MTAVIEFAKKLGSKIDISSRGVYIQSLKRPLNPPFLQTAVYPGFPTDLQSAALASMLKGKGSCLVEENIFENRFRVVEPLKKMGADIEPAADNSVKVTGVESLKAAQMRAAELRGGAALVIAGLQADGESVIDGCSYIYRGYENICRDLRELGARIANV